MLGGIYTKCICLFVFSSWYWRNSDISAILFCCIINSFHLWGQNVWQSIEQHSIDEALTTGIHDSQHAYEPKADILNTWRKLVCVEKQRNNTLREYLP